MLRALARTSLADLRRHRLQSFLIVVILATATMTLTLGVTVNRISSGSFDRFFREMHGAHVWITADPGIDLNQIAAADGVTESAGPFPLARVGLAGTGFRADPQFGLDVLGMPAMLPATGRPQIVEGRWLTAADDIVLDPDQAHFMGLRVGDDYDLAGPNGTVTLHIVGFAKNAAFWHVEGNGLSVNAYAMVLPETLARLAPDSTRWRSVLGVRLANPDESRAFAGAALDKLSPGGNVTADDWQDLREAMTENNEVYVLLLGIFSLFALLAAGLVIANAIGGRVVAQIREIGLLKAVGFRPRDVVALFLVEHLALGLVAALAGLAAGAALTPMFEEDVSNLLSTTPVSAYDPLPLLLVAGVVEGIVAFFTVLPALRGARIGTVEATTTGFARTRGDGSHLARAAARLRLPVVIVLGLKDVFARPVRAWVTVAALVLTVVTVTFSIGMEATIRDIVDHPERWGTPYDLLIDPNGVSAEQVEGVLANEPDVASYLARREVSARVEGGVTTITAFAVDGDLSPYEGSMAEGRLFAAPGEAVAAQGLLDLMGKGVGDQLRLWVDGKPLDLTIVGRIVVPDDGGLTALFGLDTYRTQIDPAAEPDDYAVILRPGVAPFAAMNALADASGGRFRVRPADDESENAFGLLRGIIFGLDLVLIVIGAVNLLTTTMLGVRERFRDVGILKAIGLTPAQAIQSVLTGVGAVAVAGVMFGIPLGLLVTRLLFDELGRRVGVGPGLGTMPDWRALLLLLPAAVVLAILGGLAPARLAASLRVSEALRYE